MGRHDSVTRGLTPELDAAFRGAGLTLLERVAVVLPDILGFNREDTEQATGLSRAEVLTLRRRAARKLRRE